MIDMIAAAVAWGLLPAGIHLMLQLQRARRRRDRRRWVSAREIQRDVRTAEPPLYTPQSFRN